jgi:hypothetical protein
VHGFARERIHGVSRGIRQEELTHRHEVEGHRARHLQTVPEHRDEAEHGEGNPQTDVKGERKQQMKISGLFLVRLSIRAVSITMLRQTS